MTIRLEDLKPGARVTGLTPDGAVELITTTWVGSDTLTAIFRTAAGGIAERTLFRDDEARLSLSEAGRNWSFEADGELLRLATEASSIIWPHTVSMVYTINRFRRRSLLPELSLVGAPPRSIKKSSGSRL